MLDQSFSFVALGIYLDPEKKKKEVAHKKYGETHGKLATLLDLANVVRKSELQVEQTVFGNYFIELDKDARRAMAARLCLRIPVIQQLLCDAREQPVVIEEYLKPCAESTKRRRAPNIETLLDLIRDGADSGDSAILRACSNVRRAS